MLTGWLHVANHGCPAEYCSFHTGFVQSAAGRGLGFHIEWAWSPVELPPAVLDLTALSARVRGIAALGR
jgi:hypothetical protein